MMSWLSDEQLDCCRDCNYKCIHECLCRDRVVCIRIVGCAPIHISVRIVQHNPVSLVDDLIEYYFKQFYTVLKICESCSNTHSQMDFAVVIIFVGNPSNLTVRKKHSFMSHRIVLRANTCACVNRHDGWWFLGFLKFGIGSLSWSLQGISDWI